MKTFWSLLAKILLVVVIVEAWFLYDYYHKNQQLVAENLQLETELIQSKDAVLAAESKVAELEKRSIEGLLKETNKAVVSGWEKLFEAVENELNKARQSIEGDGGEQQNVPKTEEEQKLNGQKSESEEPTQEAKPNEAIPNEVKPEQALPQEPIQGERT